MKVLLMIIGAIALLPIAIALAAGLSVAVLGGAIALFADLFTWAIVGILVVIGVVWLIKTIF